MKRGFTLIELLAVIVILAIIALIATPIVLSIIEETKESAVLRSAEHYLSTVELGVAKKNLTVGGSFSPNECEIQTDGNLLCDGTEVLEVELSGEAPSAGTITFNKGKIVGATLTLSNKIITKDTNGKLVLGEAQEKTICKLIADADGSDTITPGDKYQCKVKDDMETEWKDGYYFYVLSTEDDGTTNLIMDRNINSDGTPVTKLITYAQKDSNGGIYNEVKWINQDNYEAAGGSDWDDWIDSSRFGPITAMNYLNDATSTWNNISNLNLIYNDEGGHFTNFSVTGKARLPYLSEVTAVGCKAYEDLSCPVWMVDYLEDASPDYTTTEYQKNIIDRMYFYWIFSTKSDESYVALNINYSGTMRNSEIVMESSYVRPVINIKL